MLSYHYCKPCFHCPAMQGGRPRGQRDRHMYSCREHTTAPVPMTQPWCNKAHIARTCTLPLPSDHPHASLEKPIKEATDIPGAEKPKPHTKPCEAYPWGFWVNPNYPPPLCYKLPPQIAHFTPPQGSKLPPLHVVFTPGGGGGGVVKRKMKKCGKMRKKCGKMRRKKAMTRTELPVALHVVFQQHSFPVTRILVPGPKHTDGKFVF